MKTFQYASARNMFVRHLAQLGGRWPHRLYGSHLGSPNMVVSFTVPQKNPRQFGDTQSVLCFGLSPPPHTEVCTENSI